MKRMLGELQVSPFNVRNISDLVKQNVHQDFTASVEQLAEDIKTNGLINKIVLTKGKDGDLEIIAGSRRCKALEKLYGPDYILKENEYVIRDLTDMECLKISISENQQRYDLTPLELCSATHKLQEVSPNITEEEMAKSLGITVSKLKRIIELNKDIQKGSVPEAALKELAKSEDQKPAFTDKHWDKVREEEPAVIEDVVKTVIEQEVPSREVDKVIERKKRDREEKTEEVKVSGDSAGSEDLDTKIEYHYKGQLKLVEEGGKFKLFCIDPKVGEEKIDMKALLEYLRHPEKFRCEMNFRMKVLPLQP